MNYTLKALTPMLESKDLQATVDFYTKVLGFHCDNFVPEWGWVLLSRDHIEIMFMDPNEERNIPGPIMSGSLYIETDEVDEAWLLLKDKCKVCYPIEDFDYGMREFAVFDNNGYLLQYGREIEEG